jgi:hypothetical protein
MTGFFAHLLPQTPQLKPPVYFFWESSFGHWANTLSNLEKIKAARQTLQRICSTVIEEQLNQDSFANRSAHYTVQGSFGAIFTKRRTISSGMHIIYLLY